MEFLNEARRQWPRTALIGVDPPENVNLDVTGIGGYVSFPPDQAALSEAVNLAVRRANGEICQNLWTFLPAKAGCGCSTVVVQAALELARMGKNVLVMECDLRSGVMSLMLKAKPTGTMQNALGAVRAQESHRVSSAVTTVGGVDFLLSSRTRMEQLPDWSDFHGLLGQMTPKYDLVLADLPELVNEATAELVVRSRGVHLVSTQELLSLELAPRRLAELGACGVPAEKVKLVVNRYQRGELSVGEVERHVGRPVAFQLPNDYAAVRRAVLVGANVDRESALGKGYKAVGGGFGERGRGSGAVDGLGGVVGEIWWASSPAGRGACWRGLGP